MLPPLFFDKRGHWTCPMVLKNIAKFIHRSRYHIWQESIAAKKGIALLNAKGFLVKYAIRLAEITSKYGCNITILSDLDIYGLTICSKVPNVYRIGISFETLRYFNLNLEDVEEECNAPSFDMDFSKFATEEELEYLKTKRIEIDSVMIAVNDNEKFWDHCWN